MLVFIVVGSNSAIHLTLDAMEIKWANGVNMIAPFDWHLWNDGLFWPEHWIIWLLSFVGLGIVAFYALSLRPSLSRLILFRWNRILLAALLLFCYLSVPFAFFNQAREANVHFVASLSASYRTGMAIEIDRTTYMVDDEGYRIKTFAGEEINVTGNLPERSGQLTLRGHFVDHGTIWVEEFHMGQAMFRDGASVLALSLFAIVWLRYLRLELPWCRASNGKEIDEQP